MAYSGSQSYCHLRTFMDDLTSGKVLLIRELLSECGGPLCKHELLGGRVICENMNCAFSISKGIEPMF